MPSKILLNDIKIDGGTQPRVELNYNTVKEYAALIGDGVELPPIVVFSDGINYWLADGFHRFFANRDCGFKDIFAEIHAGTQRDAILYSCGVNAEHGLRRTNADKRKAVLTLLKDEEWSKWSSNKIAQICKVSNHLVDELKNYILENSKIEKIHNTEQPRIVERNGKTYEMQTANIGKRPEPQKIVNIPVSIDTGEIIDNTELDENELFELEVKECLSYLQSIKSRYEKDIFNEAFNRLVRQ